MDYLPGEIVAEILLKLPRKPLFTSNCVSKQWKSIISDPQFGQTYLQRLRSSRKTPSFFPAHEINQPPPPLSSSTSSTADGGGAEMLASSNGLILSSTPPNWGFITDYKFRVSNPLTKQSVLLPWLSLPCRKWVYGFATRLDTYKVVIIQLAGDSRRSMRSTIQIFSSDTGSWTRVEGTITCPRVVFKETQPKAFNHKGILHWFDWKARSIVTYDPYDSPRIFSHIPLPSRSSSGMNLIQLGHENMLKFGEVEEDHHDHDRSLLVWLLVDYDKGEWCLEQRCPIRLLGYNPISGLLCHVKKPVAWNDDLFCYVCAKGNMVSSVDVWDCKDELVDLKSIPHTRRQAIFPMAVCPWSSPFYRITS